MNIVVVTPVYNDWESFSELVKDIEKVAFDNSFRVTIYAVNDGSFEAFDSDKLKSGLSVNIINLNLNVGHQRAIAIGLSYVNEHLSDYDAVLVLDSDGEDKPEDIPELVNSLIETGSSKIVFAKRSKRSEGFTFRAFYFIYKYVFKMLTGKVIDFGNFSCIPKSFMKRVVFQPELWNHYSGSIIKSRIPISKVDTNRGVRYFGSSKMNLINLILHGLSSVAIYMDVVTIRLLIFSFAAIVFGGLSMFILFIVKYATDWAILGWTSSISMMIINVIIQFFTITLLIMLMQLNRRMIRQLPPCKFYSDYVESVVKPD